MYDITDYHMYIGWYNEKTGDWDKQQPDLPIFWLKDHYKEDGATDENF